jgi:hypothetical protein
MNFNLFLLAVLVLGALSWGIRGVLGGAPGALVAGATVGLFIGRFYNIPNYLAFSIACAIGTALGGMMPYGNFVLDATSANIKSKKVKAVLSYGAVGAIWGIFVILSILLTLGVGIDLHLLAFVGIGVGASFVLGLLVLLMTEKFKKVSSWKLMEFVSGAGLFGVVVIGMRFFLGSFAVSQCYQPVSDNVVSAIVFLMPLIIVVSIARNYKTKVVKNVDWHLILVVVAVNVAFVNPYWRIVYSVASIYMALGCIKSILFSDINDNNANFELLAFIILYIGFDVCLFFLWTTAH